MKPEDLKRRMETMRERYREIEQSLGDPGLYSDPALCRKLTQERRRLCSLFAVYDAWTDALDSLRENHAMLQEEQDPELRQMIESDLAEQETKAAASP